ncbi:MAG: hypothetical protein CR985_02195 [Flavobacteriales bacterium]|nr:MAG: hypothetical protein CR985_02195 [Flavobacteriales bacterium]
MKKLFILFLIAGLGFSLNAQESNNADAPKFKFKTSSVDYGTIEKNADGIRFLEFTNVGNSPLIITNVKGSCGCTVPSTPKEPIMPGETGKISVKYDTNRIGLISKTITISSNADRPTIVIPVKGRVTEESSLSKLEKHEKNMVEQKN